MANLGTRLATLAVAGAAAAAITLGTAGSASADAWIGSGSDKCGSQYALCIWDQGNYQGSGIGVPWADVWKLNNISQYYGFLGSNISSVINKTGTAFCGAEYNYGAGNAFKIQAWGWYSGLGSWDNRIRSIQKWPCDAGV
ncbi:hypothetical protein ABZT06_43365 [Streptomyces sp. NPDC005483]|uniref:hypothetical protein n=1 Tax=Streptomyces sp. NPDC005483 TaxID=3154882 RepID=UPI0033BCA959